MRCFAVFFVLVLAATPGWAGNTAAAAPNLFKCVSARGDVSFQAAPCGAGARLVWARTVVPEPVVVPPRQSSPARAARISPNPARESVDSRASARAAPPSGCETAKARRADIRDRQWRTLRFDQLRSLDDDVARACSKR